MGDGRRVRQLSQVKGFPLQRQLLNIYHDAPGKATSIEPDAEATWEPVFLPCPLTAPISIFTWHNFKSLLSPGALSSNYVRLRLSVTNKRMRKSAEARVRPSHPPSGKGHLLLLRNKIQWTLEMTSGNSAGIRDLLAFLGI